MSRRLAPWLLSPAAHGLIAGLSVAAGALLACSPASSPDAPATSEAPSAVAVAPRASTAVTATTPAPAATPLAPVATASVAAAVVSASSGPLGSAAPAASAAPAEGPLPRVKVANIGIHIGGGPNDAVTKEPFKKSVFPHHDELRRCWGTSGDGQTGDISVELKVEHEGGKARVRPNRSTFKNKDFNACVITVLEGIDFLKPRTGTTVLNYSIRFTPEK